MSNNDTNSAEQVVERQSSFTYDELIQCAHGELYGPTNGRLPLPNMLMTDRVTHISAEGGKFGKGEIRAELDINPNLWFFDVHFVDDPVMPGCLGLDAMWQLCGFFLAWSGCKGKGRALGCGEVKFTGQVLPTAKKVTYTLNVKRIITRRLSMVIADATMSVDGRAIYTANDLKVGLFLSTDSF